jgi:hypothetical protein
MSAVIANRQCPFMWIPSLGIEWRACVVFVEDEAMRECSHCVSANGEKGIEAARRTAPGIVVGDSKYFDNRSVSIGWCSWNYDGNS